MGFCLILRQHAGTRVIKGLVTDTPPKLVSFWGTRRKTTLSDPITSRTAWIQRTTLMDEVIPDNDKNIFTDWHGSCIVPRLLVKCKPNPWMLVGSYTKYLGILVLHRGLLQQTWSLTMRLFSLDSNAGACYSQARLLLLS